MSQQPSLDDYRWQSSEKTLINVNTLGWNRTTLLMVALIALFAVGLCTFVQVVPSVRNIINRSRIGNGQAVQAYLTDVTQTGVLEESYFYRVTWEFEATIPDQGAWTFQGSQRVAYDMDARNVPQPGDPVMIVYKPVNPSISMLQSVANRPGYDWMWVGADVCGAVVMLMIVSLSLFTRNYNINRLFETARDNPDTFRWVVLRHL